MIFLTASVAVLAETEAGVKYQMNQEQMETQELPRADEHPWLTQKPASEDEDSVGEVIRYTLDEIRYA